MVINTTDASFLRLLQLSSVSLPVGGFSFSQGLEYAIEDGTLTNQQQTQEWLSLQMRESVARVDLPILAGAMLALKSNDLDAWQRWNDISLANRETKELRLTETAMGEALNRLLKSLSIETPQMATRREDISFVALFAVAANVWNIEFDLAATGFLWSWLENQIAAATKLVPLGQTQAQLLIGLLQPVIFESIELSKTLDEHTLGGSLPSLAIASSLHETQYSRLFRS